jgi:hypothetical protein
MQARCQICALGHLIHQTCTILEPLNAASCKKQKNLTHICYFYDQGEGGPKTTSTILEPEPGIEVDQKLLEESGGDRFVTRVSGDLIANSQHPDHTPRSVSRSVRCVT